MSYTITPNSKAILDGRTITPQIVVKIDGYESILTSARITEVARYGNPNLFYGLEGLVYGGTIDIGEQNDLISLSGTTNQITQQLLQDEGASSSTSNVTIALVNKDNSLASLVTPQGNNDIISKKAEVYLGAEGMNFPEDFIRIFVGNITQVQTPAGVVKLTISHPESAKRDELFTAGQTELNGSITNSQTTITVTSTAGFLTPADLLKTYIRIDDEIIQYTGITATTFTGCTRAQIETIASTHADEATVDSFYVLGDATSNSNAIDLALKVLISQSEDWISALATTFTESTIYLPAVKLITDKNIRAGDSVTITGATNPGNNTTKTILDVEEDFGGTLITVSATLTPEIESTATLTANSQYNTLPTGLELTPDQVDIDEFLRIKTLFSSSIPNYKIYIKESIDGRDLVNKELLFPAACYSIPRKGQVSLGKTKPPLAEFETKILDENTVINASNLSIERSSLENFYNSVIYQYEEDPIDDKLRSLRLTLSASSQNRVKVGSKPYRVQSKGLRKGNGTETIIENNSARLLDRYQFGADKIKGMKVPFSVGWSTEIGDTVIVQGLQLFDSKTGGASLEPRIMEVTNRSFNFRSGVIELDLTDTAFAIDGRYGIISPSSYTAAGSTTSEIQIKRSFATTDTEFEKDKWQNYIGNSILIHSPDWTYQQFTTIVGFSPSNDSVMIVDPPVATPPLENYIVDIPTYDEADPIHKTIHCYFDPQLTVTANATVLNQITVNLPLLVFPGSVIKVGTQPEVTVESIAGSVLTLNTNLDSLALTGDKVELVGFVSDFGLPYRIL